MTQREQILALLDGRVNNFENMADGAELNSAAQAQLVEQFGNPAFKAQFDINFYVRYFSVAAGVYTRVLAAAMPAALQQRLLAFLFGVSDFWTGYTKSKQQYPLTNWTYDAPFIYGSDTNNFINGVAIDATVKGQLAAGDVVIPAYGASGGTNYVALVIERSPQVPFGQLLQATGSDIYVINGVRYQLHNQAAAALLQFQNPFGLFRNNLFGAFLTDSFNPGSYLQPSNQQTDVLDLPLKQVIDKYGILAVPINYDREDGVTLNVFVNRIDKLKI